LKGALLIDPDFLDAKAELATSYIHQIETGLLESDDGFAKIIAITDQVLAVRPDDAVARAAKLFADSALRVNDGDTNNLLDTVRQLEEIVAAAPDELQPRILLVRSYYGLQQYDKVIPVLEDALQRDPFNPQIHYELGTAYLRLERWEDARASLEKSLDIEPAQPNAYVYLGDLSLRSGDGVGYVNQFLKALEVDPKDHELPGILAAFLYQLGLVEEGDDLRNRVLALAPTSEVAYRIELLRAISIGDEEASIASARRAIEDNVENRRFGFGGAVRYLLRDATRRGTVEVEFSYLDEKAPGMFDIEAAAVPQKYRMVQGIAFDAWFATLPREEVLRRLDILLERGASVGLDPMRDPGVYLSILAMRGEIAAAIDVALERVFSQSVAMNLGWRENFAQLQYAEIVTDPRVQAAMRRWEDEELALRGQVQTYLADLHAAT